MLKFTDNKEHEKKLILTLSISQLLIIQSSYANQGQYTLNCNISGASNPSQSQTGAPASRVRISSADAQHVCKKVLASLTSSQPAGSPQPAQAQTVTLGEISYNQIPEPKLRDLKQITAVPSFISRCSRSIHLTPNQRFS